VEKYGRARQATDDIIIRWVRIACWINKATSAHSEYVIFIALSRQKWLRERNSILRYTYIACLVLFCFCHFLSPSLTLRNSILPTEGIFVFSVDIRTVIICLYFSNWLVSMTETECLISCATEFLNVLQIVVFEGLKTN